MASFAVVVATAGKRKAIGKGNALPWHLKKDLRFFKQLTSTCAAGKKNAVIMGRNTWISIPEKFKPLSDRVNVILSRSPDCRSALNLTGNSDVLVETSLSNALAQLATMSSVDQVFVIGGSQLYEEALESPQCGKLYVTDILNEVPDCDVFFPTIAADMFRMTQRTAVEQEGELRFRFVQYSAIGEDAMEANCEVPPLPHAAAAGAVSPSPKTVAEAAAATPSPLSAPRLKDTSPNPEEVQYLAAIDDILRTGVLRGDRTGTGTISKFGVQMRYSLRNDVMPLLTTKRVFWRGLAEELLWFIKGSTNANELAAKDIHIWDGNGSRDFLDKLGFTEREVGDLGPVYGFQWRHFGAAYSNMHADYTGCGIDQLAKCIETIKTNPTDRRIVMSAWNVADVDKMALPPCHMFCQFYVANGELSCQMYQRSADMGLGVPFNIASYALLTRLVAQVCGLKAGDFVHAIGDAHVYCNHVEALKQQLEREPRAFPTLTINPDVKDIDGFNYSDFTVHGYNPHATIKMQMAV